MTVDFFQRAGTVYFAKDNRKMGHQALVSLDEQYFNKKAGGPGGPFFTCYLFNVQFHLSIFYYLQQNYIRRLQSFTFYNTLPQLMLKVSSGALSGGHEVLIL